MISRQNRHDRGSVILIAVGLLVMLAMVGTTFVLVAYSDRREADKIARGAPMKKVALGALTKLQAVLIEDLHFNPAGLSTHPYEAATEWMQQVDGPYRTVDPWLASIMPKDLGGGHKAYEHVSDLYGTLREKADSLYARIDPTPDTPEIAGGSGYGFDTDGDGWIDSLLEDTGIRDAAGARYYVAVRVIDLCGHINVDTAYKPDWDAGDAVGRMDVMPFGADNDAYKTGRTRGLPVTHIDASKIGLDVERLHMIRCGATIPARSLSIATYWYCYVCTAPNQTGRIRLPFGQTYVPVFAQDDMLALLWRETDNTKATFTGRGRLMQDVIGTDAAGLAKRKFLTTWSAARILPLHIPGTVAGQPYVQRPQEVRADLNEGDFWELYTAFFNAIYRNIPGFTDGLDPDAKRRALAAQMAVNTIDFRDNDENVTVHAVPNADDSDSTDLVFGIEQQPFITEAFHKVYTEADNAQPIKYSAIELFNPYEGKISLKGVRIKQGAAWMTITGGWPALTVPGHGRVVIVSSKAAFPVHAHTPAGRVVVVPGLDISLGVKIYRSRLANGSSPDSKKDVLLASLDADELNAGAPPEPYPSKVFVARQWDDRLPKARYALAGRSWQVNPAVDYTSENADTPMTPGRTTLGSSNKITTQITAGEPTPVYVRNDKFISIGEINRIFFIGPSETKGCLAKQLGEGGDIAQGRLDVLQGLPAGSAAIPPLPPACLISDFVTVINPAKDELDNNGNWIVDEDPPGADYERVVYGPININTAPREVMLCLPYITSDVLDGRTGMLAARGLTAFAAAGEFLYYLRYRRNPIVDNNYDPGPNYMVGPPRCMTDDGLDKVHNDLTKHEIMYTRVANMITVRSDTFAAYISVLRYPPGANLHSPDAVKRYVAVVDRSECYKRGHWPRIHMFAAIK